MSRINIYDQVKGFYSVVFEGKYEFKPQHISLYMFLLNQNNRNNWVEWFKCPYDLAMQGAGLSNKETYYKCLKDLSEWGFIKYEKGENSWKAAKIKVEVLQRTSTATSSVPQSEPLVQPLVLPLPDPLIILITNNQILVTKNIERWISEELQKPKILKEKFADFVSMTNEEYSKLVEILGEEDTKLAIKILDNYKGSNGKKYKDDFRAIQSWVIDKIKKEKSSGKKEKGKIETLAEQHDQLIKHNETKYGHQQTSIGFYPDSV